jgi:hypothetical protein
MSFKGENDINEKVQRFNEILYTKLSHLQFDMLTFNLPKDQIKVLVDKICRNAHSFPEHHLNDLKVIHINDLIYRF